MLKTAFLEALRNGLIVASLRTNILAGITVGIVALPLSMGLAIAVGLPPEHGLYTAIVGGIVIALCGGSSVNISGPTAAFVVILLPIVQEHGISGLLVSGMLSGIILMAMGRFKLGRFIRIVPYPVVIGFTAGIGTVIAFLQIKDLLGLPLAHADTHFLERIPVYLSGVGNLQWAEATIGLSTLVVIIYWRRVPLRIPSHLIGMLWGTGIAAVFNYVDVIPDVDTIATRFTFTVNGITGVGVPPVLPTFSLPWESGSSLSLDMVRTLFGAAMSIAILGALESLLCATVADGMTGQRHDPDRELIGQGIGNIVVPFFGGIPATAAIARTALNVRSGGSTPVAAIVHSIFLLITMLTLAPLLSHIPMAAIAAILVVVAWNMSEVQHVVHLVRRAPRSDVGVFIICYGLTVVIDMQVAVAAGMVLAAAMFVHRMSELTKTQLLENANQHPHLKSKQGVVVYDVDGPLFFGAAHKALSIVTAIDQDVQIVILDLTDVPAIDSTALVNLRSLAESMRHRGVRLYLLNTRPNVRGKIENFGIISDSDNTRLIANLEDVE